MRNRSRLLVLLAVVLVATFGAANTITFDGVANGTVVNTNYSGVTFSCLSCGLGAGPDVYARTDGSNNVVSILSTGIPIFDARYGGVQATFGTAQSSVSIDAKAIPFVEALGTPTNQPFLEAFDSSNNLLSKVLYPLAYGASGYGNFQTLSINTGTNNIAYIIFSSQSASGPIVYGEFDNLTFDVAGGGGNDGGGPKVPEPSSLVIMASGVSALLLKKRMWN